MMHLIQIVEAICHIFSSVRSIIYFTDGMLVTDLYGHHQRCKVTKQRYRARSHISRNAQRMNVNSPCGPVTVVTLIAVVLNNRGIDGIVLMTMLASTSEIVATLINDSFDYFDQFKDSLFTATSCTFKRVTRFSVILTSALTIDTRYTERSVGEHIELSRISFSVVALTACV
jgi:hypothetical protein